MTTPNPSPDAEELRKFCSAILNDPDYSDYDSDHHILAKALLQRLDAESTKDADAAYVEAFKRTHGHEPGTNNPTRAYFKMGAAWSAAQRSGADRVSVLAICMAYEYGYGHGQNEYGLPSPYKPDSQEDEAYKIGYDEGYNVAKLPRATAQPTDAEEFRKQLIEFSDFLNEPPQYEDRRMVRDYRHEACRKWMPLVEALLRRLSAPVEEAGKVPDGFVLVPREPTKEMQKAAEAMDIASDFKYPWQYVELYKAMLAASPAPAPKEGT